MLGFGDGPIALQKFITHYKNQMHPHNYPTNSLPYQDAQGRSVDIQDSGEVI